MRPLLVLAHRWAGLALAGFLLVVGLTGSVLAFDDALDAWLNPGLFRSSSGPPLPLERLIAAAEQDDRRATVTRVSFPTPARGSVLLGVAPRDPAAPLGYDQLFVDPASARVLGRRDSGGCCLAAPVLIPFLFRVHYTLGAGRAGTWVMGSAALLWCVDCFVGLWLTFPRGRPFWRRWRPAWGIKPTRNAFRLTFDIHRAGGLWCWICLLLIAVSAVALTLRAEVFLPAVRAVLPVTPDVQPASPATPAIGLPAAAARAEQALPGRRVTDIYAMPRAGLYGLTVAPQGREPWTGLGPDVVWMAAHDGTVLRLDRAGHGLAGDTVLALQYPLHSGRIAGLPSRVLVCALGIAVAILSLTGPWLWRRKRRASGRSRRVS